ncbi:hypothetical protein Tco_0496641 [Tanacetum coccineum]
MMSLFKSNSNFSEAFSQFESAGASGSGGSGRCRDDEESADDKEDDDEDGDGDILAKIHGLSSVSLQSGYLVIFFTRQQLTNDYESQASGEMIKLRSIHRLKESQEEGEFNVKKEPNGFRNERPGKNRVDSFEEGEIMVNRSMMGCVKDCLVERDWTIR